MELPTCLIGRSFSSCDGSAGAVNVDVILELTDLGGAGRQYQVLQIHRVHHVGGRQTLRLKQRRIQIDHHLGLFAAVGIRNRRAGYRDELGSQKIQAEVVELLLGEALPGKRKLDDRHGRSAEVEDQGGLRAGGQLAQSDLRYRRDLRVGGIETRVGLEKDFDDRLTIDGCRFDVLDVVDGRGENALEAGRECGLPSLPDSGR